MLKMKLLSSEEQGKHIEDPVKKVLREGSFYGLVDNTVLITKDGMEIPVDVIGSPV